MSPGQVLIAMQLERAATLQSFDWMDTVGPESESVKRWSNDSYPVAA